ncbi:hypothetical protein ACFWY5_23615 [Nonomuraea sp. NPDC059007]|uniref:hypothetical protein n=1 Tax=Nonomuraea sp. NPDC059007 TaxID=3346692 RepID=UPI003674F22A
MRKPRPSEQRKPLVVESLTEQRLVPSPSVYGNIQAAGISPARCAALTSAITAFCEMRELQLAGMFTDRDGAEQSAAFVGLLDMLALPATYGLVVPTLNHLGPRPALVAARAREVQAIGVRLLTIRTTPVRHRSPCTTATVYPT